MKIIRYVAGLLALSAAAASAQETTDYRDAAVLLQGGNSLPILAADQIGVVTDELRAIRDQFPEISDIHPFARWKLDEILAGVTPEAGTSLLSGPAVRDTDRPGFYALSPLQTGLSDLDAVNAQLPVKEILVQVSDSSAGGREVSALFIRFQEILNIPATVLLYAKTASLRYVQPSYMIGDGSDVRRHVGTGEVRYVFRRAEGDCPAGCSLSRYYFFRLIPSPEGYRVVQEPPPDAMPRRPFPMIPPASPVF